MYGLIDDKTKSHNQIYITNMAFVYGLKATVN